VIFLQLKKLYKIGLNNHLILIFNFSTGDLIKIYSKSLYFIENFPPILVNFLLNLFARGILFDEFKDIFILM